VLACLGPVYWPPPLSPPCVPAFPPTFFVCAGLSSCATWANHAGGGAGSTGGYGAFGATAASGAMGGTLGSMAGGLDATALPHLGRTHSADPGTAARKAKTMKSLEELTKNPLASSAWA
jgi:hypothetical protein